VCEDGLRVAVREAFRVAFDGRLASSLFPGDRAHLVYSNATRASSPQVFKTRTNINAEQRTVKYSRISQLRFRARVASV
jgi:hypothetical protein